jgi:hypothetical protein
MGVAVSPWSCGDATPRVAIYQRATLTFHFIWLSLFGTGECDHDNQPTPVADTAGVPRQGATGSLSPM